MSMLSILGPDGSLRGDIPEGLSEPMLIRIYEDMLASRIFDEWMLKIHPMGRISRYPPSEGQEAAMVGSAHALTDRDWVFPTYREFPVYIAKRVPLGELMNRMLANREDILKGHEITLYGNKERRIVVPSGPVATMIPVAVGFSMAFKLQREPAVSLVYFGEGATSKCDFHEAINFAGVFKTPTVFFCQNNQWAISIPVSRQTACARIADKGSAYGVPSVRVDGNDALAVYSATREALERARRGGGPTLIEAYTFRMGPHTTADDPHRYRSEEEVEAWRRLDPLLRMRSLLEGMSLWDESREEAFSSWFKERLREAMEEAESIPPPGLEVIFEDVYSDLPWHLEEEREEALRDELGE